MSTYFNLTPYLKKDTEFFKLYQKLWNNKQYFFTNLIAFMVVSLLPISADLFNKVYNSKTEQNKNDMVSNFLNITDTYFPTSTKLKKLYTYDYIIELDGTLLVSVITDIVENVNIIDDKSN